MTKNLNELAYVLAGGPGTRLMPLTQDRAKPAVPFGGAYRIIDFVMTNLFNSSVRKIAVLTQYKPGSLKRHFQSGYEPVFANIRSEHPDSFFRALDPISVNYTGTADAIYRNMAVTREGAFDVIYIFGADHVYRMNVSQMGQFHLEKEADATISVMPVDIDVAKGLGVVTVNKDGRITKFEEKPGNPTPMPSDKSKCLASMGNYAFNPRSLEDVLQGNPEDFGHHVFSNMIKSKKRVFAYDFLQNNIPGYSSSEVIYWRDVGTLQQYFDSHMDLLGETPKLMLHHQKWRMLTNIDVAEPSRTANRALCLDSLTANGVWYHDDATVKSSVVSYSTEIQKGADVSNSILLGYIVVGEGSVIRDTIVDRRVIIPPKTVIGVDKNEDQRRHFHVEGNITVVPRGYKFK